MDRAQAFIYFWLAMVALIGVAHLAWAINDIRAGSARMAWRGWGGTGFGARVERVEEPFEYWFAVGSKLVTFVATLFMFWFGFGMLNT